MTADEEKDHLAVRIKHHGPCPLEKGHPNPESFVIGVAMGMIVGAIIALCFAGVIK